MSRQLEMKKVRGGGVVVACALAVGLVVELGCRFIEPLVAPRMAAAPVDGAVRESMDRSNEAITKSLEEAGLEPDAPNSLWQWDREHRPDEQPRVLALADEATLGLSVPRIDTGLAVFERALLEAQPDTRTGVFRVGTVRSGQVEQEILMHHLWPRIRPSMVLVLVNEVNDTTDNLGLNRRHHGIDERLGGRPLANVWLAGEPTSHLAMFRLLDLRRLQSSIDDQVAETRELLSHRAALPFTDHAAQRFVWAFGRRFESDWEVTAMVLERMREFVARRGAELVLVRVPSRLALEDSAWRHISRAVCGDSTGSIQRSCGPLDRERTARELAAFAARHDLLYIDPAPAMRRHAVTGEELFLDEPAAAFSSTGHARFGEALAEALAQRLVGARAPEPAPEESQQPEAEPDEEVLPVNDTRVELTGFYSIEGPKHERFAWTHERSEISVRELEPGARFEIGLRARGPSPQRLQVGLPGGAMHEMELDEELMFPEPVVPDAGGVVRLVLEAPIWRPRDLDPESPDERELGVAITAVVIRPLSGQQD